MDNNENLGVNIADITNVSDLVFITDGGVRVSTPSVINTNSPKKDGCLFLASSTGATVKNAAKNTNVTGTDGNWGGPAPRHLDISNVAFCDGHVKSMAASQWYFDPGNKWIDRTKGGP